MQNILANPWVRRALAVLAGLLLAAAFPDWNIAGLAWIAPALMLAAARGADGWRRFRLGWLAGFTFWLASLAWLLLIPVRGFPILGWLALSAYCALFTAVWVWLITNFEFQMSNFSSRAAWTLGGAAAWVTLEILRAWLLGGFPWNPLGASQFRLTPLIQLASVTGVHGVSFLVVWLSLSLLNAADSIVAQPTRRFAWQAEIILPLATVAFVFASGMIRLKTPPPEKSVRVTMIQPAVPQTMIWDERGNTNRFNQLLALSETALEKNTDIFVWPESALPELNEATFTAISGFVRRHRVWMIFGADDIEPKANPASAEKYDVFNAAFLLDPDGRVAAIYRKRQLVIFGEYIPLASRLPFMKWLTPITGGFEPGDRPVPFTIENPELKIAPLICYEDVFPEIARESADDDTDFFVNLTNDGWFGEGAAQWQQAAAAAFRAVENGLPLVRCCNTGLTGVVDSRGRTEIFRDAKGTIYGAGFMRAEVPLHAAEKTFYRTHGGWFGRACLAATAVLFFRRIRRTRAPGTEPA